MLSKDFEMFGREWEDFSNKLEKATSGREKLDKRVGRISSKFEAIKTNNPQEIEEQDNPSLPFDEEK